MPPRATQASVMLVVVASAAVVAVPELTIALFLPDEEQPVQTAPQAASAAAEAMPAAAEATPAAAEAAPAAAEAAPITALEALTAVPAAATPGAAEAAPAAVEATPAAAVRRIPTIEVMVHQEFSGAKGLTHKARITRLKKIALALGLQPTASIPAAIADAHQTKLAYRFFANGMVTVEGILSGHFEQTLRRCRQFRRILLIGDTTSLNFRGRGKGRKRIRGTGRISTRNSPQGFLTHSVLAASGDGERHEPLGLLHQESWHRRWNRKKKKESSAQRRKHRRESKRWGESQKRIMKRLPEGEPVPYFVVVWDREGDIFDAMEDVLALKSGFIIRSAKDRRLTDEENPKTKKKEPRYLNEKVRTFPVRATKQVTVRKTDKRPERIAAVEVSGAEVEVQPPKSRGRQGNPLKMNAVLVKEVAPPKGVTPLSWTLLTSEPIGTEEELLWVVSAYEARWLIEELHMGIKTGCATETRQMENGHSLKNFTAVASVLAWHMLRLRDAAQQPSEVPAREALEPTFFAALRAERPKLKEDCTSREALREIAKMGGFMGRKGDGEPGWRTIWRGWERLIALEKGFRAGYAAGVRAQKEKDPGEAAPNAAKSSG